MATRRRLQSRPGAIIRPRFEPEYLWSIDVGAKGEWLDRRLYADVTAFYMKREDMQISTGVQLDPVGDPGSYFFLTDNASGGRNLGLESSLRWRATDNWKSAARSACCVLAITVIARPAKT